MGKLKEVFLHDELLQENLRSISSWEKTLHEPAPIPKVKAGLTLTYKDSQKLIESNDLPYGRPMRFVEPPGVTPISRVARNEPKTLLNRLLTKNNIKTAARYAGIFTATNLLLPGQFWANAASSAGFDVARHLATKKGITGWKSLAAGVGGSIAAHAIMGLSFSGKDDYWNSIEGLFHGGMAEIQRKELTAFGSGWTRKIVNLFRKKELTPIAQEVKKEFFNYGQQLGPALNVGFSTHKIKELASLAKKESVGDFAKRLNVETTLNDTQSEIINAYFGGGATILSREHLPTNLPQEMSQAIDTLESMGLKSGKSYVNTKSVYETLGSIGGFSEEQIASRRKEIEENIVKMTIFHEATEGRNIKAFYKGGASIELMQGTSAGHQAAVAQEELFLRSLGHKETYDFMKQVRESSDPSSGVYISGKDDAYNTIEGLRHGGLAEFIRKQLTEFGSGWDSARAMARSIYKGMDEQAAFDKFRRSDLFRSSISKALQGEGKFLGSGLTADAYTYTASIKHGIEGVSEELPFVVKKTTNERIEKQILDRAANNMSDTSMAAINNPAREASWAAKVKEEASGWINNLQEKTIQAEERSLAKAGQYNAPSLYGTGKEYGIGNAIIMEKFEGEVLKGGLSLKEAKEAYSSLKKVHQAGVTHTDLWKENLFRTKEGNIGILDFGMANRLEGEGIHAKAWKGREDIIQEAAQSVLGRKTSAREFQETLDASRIYAHYLEGQGKKTEAEKIHRFYGSFLSSTSTSGLITESENLFKAKLAADKALGTGIKEEVVPYIKATRKPIGSNLEHAQTELFENSMERAKTNAFKAPVIQTKTSSGLGTLEEHGREAFADTILQPNRVPNEILASPVDNVASTFAAAQQYSPTMIQQDLQMGVKAPSVIAPTAAERRTQIRRIKKFQSASMAATGLGFKSAKNAGRRHNNFSTLG